jgi:hypothetical protein
MKTAQVLSILLVATTRVLAWGDDGHKTVALIAEHFLDPAVKAKVTAMLDADPDDLTPHDLASEPPGQTNTAIATIVATTTRRLKTGTSSTWK